MPGPKRRTAKASAPRKRPSYLFRLYVTGQTPRSLNSVRNLKSILDEFLPGRFDLEVVDIYQRPERAREAQIIAAPTLVKSLPPPMRKLIGDLSNRSAVLLSLDLPDA